MESKYSKFLTVLLIIIIVGVIGLIGYLAYDYFKNKNIEQEAAEYVQSFTDTSEQTIDPIDPIDTEGNTNTEQNIENQVEVEVEDYENSTGSSGGSQKKEPERYKGFITLGTIEIPKTNVKYPVLETPTKKALEVAVAVLYPNNTQLNAKRNIVIIGHNYRNGKFFSNNKNLSNGDKIIITDLNKQKVTYIIYKKFETDANDTSFYNRDTKGAREITLSTCTDDSKARTIIFAKAEGY